MDLNDKDWKLLGKKRGSMSQVSLLPRYSGTELSGEGGHMANMREAGAVSRQWCSAQTDHGKQQV